MENNINTIVNEAITEELAKNLLTVDNAIMNSAEVAKENTGYVEDVTEDSQALVNAAVGTNDIKFQMPRKTRTIIKEYKDIGRNDPCPCGSGKKYKHCCLITGQYDNRREVTSEEAYELKTNKTSIDKLKKNF